MKRVVALFLVFVVILGLCACGNTTSSSSSDEKAEWEKFIDDYNKWADDYIELANKYKANPTDMSIVTDYTNMASDVAEWAAKADKITAELENSPSEAKDFAAELLKISNKLAKAAQ